MRRCLAAMPLVRAALRGENTGLVGCPCLEFTGLETYMYRKRTLDHHAPGGEDHVFYNSCIHPSMPWSSINTTELCFPRYYGETVCWAWDMRRPPECANGYVFSNSELERNSNFF